MPSRLSTDRSPAWSPGRGPFGAPIPRACRLEGGTDAVRRDARGGASDPRVRREHVPRGPTMRRFTLGEPPSAALEGRTRPTATVTGCPADARPAGGEFRIVRPDGPLRTVHTRGGPVPGADGGTASMRAVPRDVGEPRRGRPVVCETRDSPQHHRRRARTGHRLVAEPRGACCRHGTLPAASVPGPSRRSPRPTAPPRPAAVPRRDGRQRPRRRSARRRGGSLPRAGREGSGDGRPAPAAQRRPVPRHRVPLPGRNREGTAAALRLLCLLCLLHLAPRFTAGRDARQRVRTAVEESGGTGPGDVPRVPAVCRMPAG